MEYNKTAFRANRNVRLQDGTVGEIDAYFARIEGTQNSFGPSPSYLS